MSRKRKIPEIKFSFSIFHIRHCLMTYHSAREVKDPCFPPFVENSLSTYVNIWALRHFHHKIRATLASRLNTLCHTCSCRCTNLQKNIEATKLPPTLIQYTRTPFEIPHSKIGHKHQTKFLHTSEMRGNKNSWRPHEACSRFTSTLNISLLKYTFFPRCYNTHTIPSRLVLIPASQILISLPQWYYKCVPQITITHYFWARQLSVWKQNI